MTHETLRSVALDVIDNYRRTAKSAADVWRQGSAKNMERIDSTLDDLLKYEGKISKKLKSSLETATEKLVSATETYDEGAGKLEKKIKSTLTSTQKKFVSATDKADSAVDKLLAGTSKKLAKIPAEDTQLSKLLNSKVATSIEPLGIKGAKLLRYVSSTLADGAEKVSHKLGGTKKPAKVAKKATVAVKKTAPVHRTKTVAKSAKVAKQKVSASTPS